METKEEIVKSLKKLLKSGRSKLKELRGYAIAIHSDDSLDPLETEIDTIKKIINFIDDKKCNFYSNDLDTEEFKSNMTVGR